MSVHGFVILGAMLVLLGMLLWVATAMGMALMMLRPPRMTDGKALYLLRRLGPGDLGLAFEETSFVVRDARTGQTLKLAGWWMPHEEARGRCAVLLHGYSDAKVGAIAWAPMLHALRMNVLAIDLRAHGESEGTYSTGGFFERDDVNQVVNQLQAQRPEDARQVVLFGISMGAAVAAAAAAMRDDLAGVILESPFADHYQAAVVHAHLHGLPGNGFVWAAQRFVKVFTGADLREVRPVDMVGKIRCPLLVIHCADDPFVPERDAEALEAAVRARPAEWGPTVYWRVEGAAHVMALCADPAEYQRRVGEFLESLPAMRATAHTPDT
jgi:fermentation-respiration switch protein FrsA (DUF1100 family)